MDRELAARHDAATMKNWYTIKAAAQDGGTAEISIFDEINPFYGVSAKDFIAEFKAKTSNAEKVVLSINSPGGEVFNGFAIYNALKASGKTIIGRVMGIAASMASVVLMACDEVEMPKNAMVMVHNARNFGGGTADDHRFLADLLDKVDNSIVAIYTEKTGKTEAEVRELLKDETFLTAEEAVELGFATKVIDMAPVKAAFDLDGLPADVKALFEAAKPTPSPTPAPPAPTATLADQIKAAADAAGLGEFVAVWAADDSLTTIDAIQTRIGVAREIKAFATLVGRPDDAAALIRDGKSLAEARKAVGAAAVAADKNINTAPPAKAVKSGDSVHDYDPGAVWARIRERELASGAKK